MLFTKTQERH